jgi:rare lipoprotein A
VRLFPRLVARLLLAGLVFGLSSCARKNAPHIPPIVVPHEQKGQQGEVFLGLASYYGAEFEGKKTASNTTYDPNQLTAAHRTLPFGTRVRVTNLENNRYVEVIITDRGPSRADRVIDLSWAAARELNMLASGVVKVRVEVLHE